MTKGEPFLRKWEFIKGPDGMAYVLTRDVFSGEIIAYDEFKPIGGAPEPTSGKPLPDWLVTWLRDVKRYVVDGG